MVIQVSAKPGARESTLVQSVDGNWRAQLKARPVDGRANAELITLVAAYFGCPKSAVSIRSGGSGRTKQVSIEGR